MGVRWLSRRCSVVLYEFATAADENPDVIGWVPGADSVLIECKLTRADFLRDATKAVRRNPRAGMGQRLQRLARRRLEDRPGFQDRHRLQSPPDRLGQVVQHEHAA